MDMLWCIPNREEIDMKVIIIDGLGNVKEVDASNGFVPRVGDRVDMGYTPAPTVLNVLLYPPECDFVDKDTLAVATVG